MAIYDLKANLDLKQNMNVYATCKQLDNLNLILSIYNNSVQVDLSSYTVRLKAMKADKVPLVQQGTGISISNNVVTIECDEQLTTTSGKTLIELQFIDNSTAKKKATFNLVLIVIASTLADGATISKSTYTLLEELENKMDQASNFFENIDEAITANNNLQDSIYTGNTLKTNLDNNITTGNTLNNDLETNISAGNILKPNLEGAVTSANTAKAELDISIQDANTFVSEHGDIIDLDNRVTQNTSQLNEKANRGFIINSDFLIWQRGESFTLGGSPQYSSDRWAVGSSTSQALKIEKVDSGLKMTWLKQEIGVITQYLELPNKKRLIGKKISISISINNLIYTYTTILDDINKYINFDLSNKVFTVETHTDTKYYIRLFHSDAPIGTTYEINHIRDVFGSVSNFIPISYGEELSLCQRYYRVLETGELMGQFYRANACRIYSTLNPPMRVTPTITFPTANDNIYIDAIGSGNKTGGTVEIRSETSSECIHFDVTNITDVSGLYQQARYVHSIQLDSEIR